MENFSQNKINLPFTPEERELALRELMSFGLEGNNENIEAVVSQMKLVQHPAGFKEILNSLGDEEALIKAMTERGINKIVHSEGANLWAHVKNALKEIEIMDLSAEEKMDLKLIMLYHDLGKTVVASNDKNIEQTKKKVAKGELHQAMIGHHLEKLEEIRSGFSANKIEGSKLEIFMRVVENHMNTAILEQDVRKTAKLFDSFAEGEDEIKRVVKLLVAVLQIDGNATEHINLVDSKLQYSRNEKKTAFTFEMVWQRYLEGKKILKEEELNKKKQEEQGSMEVAVFGKKITEYLINDRGVSPGPAMGRSMVKIKKIMQENKDLLPAEIKAKVDETVF